jgi:hypothetical protein
MIDNFSQKNPLVGASSGRQRTMAIVLDIATKWRGQLVS